MKHLIILVLVTLSLNQNAEAQGDNTIESELPNFISQIDFDLPSSPFVIIKKLKICMYCDPDMRSSHLIFQDTKTMKTLKDITGFNFRQLATKSLMDSTGETDEEYQKIIETSSMYYGHHLVNWVLEKPQYNTKQKYSDSYCSIYALEACDYVKTRTCQLIKSQNVKMRVLNDRSAKTYTEFQGSESKVIREWEIPMSESCSNNKLN